MSYQNLAYLGPPGTHTHRAALMIEAASKLLPYSSIPELTDALEKGTIQRAVLPLENSLQGTVAATIDYLAKTTKTISAEIVLDIDHILACRKGTRISDLKIIASHPQALAQCSDYLKKLNIPVYQATSTVAAIEEMQQHNNMGVIVSKLAAEIYDLEILAESIADSQNNVTRFCVMSNYFTEQTGNDKTSIIFEIQDKPGSLFEILRFFSEANINLTKIESRPAKCRLGRYLFAIDFEGHIADLSVQSIIIDVEKQCIFFKVLGSYPIY